MNPATFGARIDRGLIPAVPVPFRADGQIDVPAQERYVAYMAAQPIAGVAVWAHTGRGLRLSREQRAAILRSWVAGRFACERNVRTPQSGVAGNTCPP